MNQPLHSYYDYRRAAGFYGLGDLGVSYLGPPTKKPGTAGNPATVPGNVGTPDTAYCAAHSSSCSDCYSCCASSFPGNQKHLERCKTRCLMVYGASACGAGGGTGGGTGGGITPCGGSCTSDAGCCSGQKCISGQCATCGIECEGPGTNTPYTCNYRCVGVGVTNVGSIFSSPSPSAAPATTIIGYDANGAPIYSTSSAGSDPLSLLTDHPFLALAGIALLAWRFLK